MPYIPGFLSFPRISRAAGSVGDAVAKPDLVFVDGHGISHPRRLGVASHFGLLVDVPTIGVAKKRLCGKIRTALQRTGRAGPLMDKGEQLAWVWRSKARCNPLFIATGHRVSVDSALEWVQRCMKAIVCRSQRAGRTRWPRNVRRSCAIQQISPNSGKLRIISVFENSTCYKTQFICV